MGHKVHHIQRAMGPANLKTTMGCYRFLKDDLNPMVEQEPAQDELGGLAKG
jgi:hypothetical protein